MNIQAISAGSHGSEARRPDNPRLRTAAHEFEASMMKEFLKPLEHDSLFAEFDSHNFEAIDHRGYKQVLRQTRALQNRLFDCTKFETLVRYRCANLFFLVLPRELFRDPEIPIGWGALIEAEGDLVLVRKPVWHEVSEQSQLQFLQRIARAGTRALNRTLEITFEDVAAMGCRS